MKDKDAEGVLIWKHNYSHFYTRLDFPRKITLMALDSQENVTANCFFEYSVFFSLSDRGPYYDNNDLCILHETGVIHLLPACYFLRINMTKLALVKWKVVIRHTFSYIKILLPPHFLYILYGNNAPTNFTKRSPTNIRTKIHLD
jgi:hypothetical protein